MTKLVLLVGFLGAGKTTMMKEILDEYKDLKVGVIVNEFGEINIDAKLLEDEGLTIAELTNGSIFCACIKDKFVDSLIQMSGYGLDYVFIEASGLADPANISQILEGISSKLLNPYDYRGSLCIIDGESFVDLYEVLPAITSQLEFSSAVIINKSDLIDEETLGEITGIISGINPDALTVVTSYCKVNTREIVDEISVSDRESRDSLNTTESRPTVFILKDSGTDLSSGPVPYENLMDFIGDIVDSTYRIKGFAKTDKGDVEISVVGKHINLTPWEKPLDKSEIVVISSVGFKLMSIITKAISDHVKGYLRI